MNPDRRTPPAVHPWTFRALPPEKVEVLANGVTFHRYITPQDSVGDLALYFRGGYLAAPESLCNAVCAAWPEGAGDMSGARIADEFDLAGARLNTRSGYFYTGLKCTVLNHSLPSVLPIVKAMCSAPHFPEEALRSFVNSSLARLSIAENKVNYRASTRGRRMVFGAAHPLAQTTDAGSLRSLDTAQLHDFHRRLIDPAGLHAYLAGGFDSMTIDLVRNYLSALPAQPASVQPLQHGTIPPATPEAPGEESIEMERAVQSAIYAGIPAPGRQSEDFINLRLTVMALGGYFGARLMKNIREDKGLTYGITASLSAVGAGAAAEISAECKSEATGQVIDEIRRELEEMVTNPPRGEELERLKLFATGTLMDTLDSPLSISAYHQLQILNAMPQEYFENQQRAIAALTPDTLSAMAAKYLSPSALRIVTAGPSRG